jgi:hypothetical protein
MVRLATLALPAPPAPGTEEIRVRRRAGRRAGTVGLAVWAVVVAASVIWPKVSKLPPRAGIDAAPFYGSWDWHAPGWMLLAGAVGLVAVVVGPAACERLPRPWLAPVTGVAASSWAVLVAACGGGIDRVAATLESKYEYLPFAGRIDGPAFLRTYVERAHGYPTHVKGHPPGMTLVFWALDRLGLHGPGWAAVLVLTGWAAGAGAVVWTMAELAGVDRARRAAPFVALVPGVVWAATSGDALIAGVTAVGIAFVVAATSATRSRATTAALGVAGGLVLGVALHLSYGVAPLLLVPLAVAIVRRRIMPLVAAAAGAATVTGLFVAGGFWWFDGLSLTRTFYLRGLARLRPYSYFVIAGNLGALALAVGPAGAAGFGRLVGHARRRPELVALAAVLVAVLLADVSGMSKAEVERIWLPYTLWLAAAAGAVSTRWTRWWLAAQVALGVGLEVWLVTTW